MIDHMRKVVGKTVEGHEIKQKLLAAFFWPMIAARKLLPVGRSYSLEEE